MASTITSRWAVSTRTRGEVLTAGVSAPALELVLLGIPAAFSAAEVEGWLRDLAGVALETSREDSRTHAIPPLLHHALTGLLFSHAELWRTPAGRGPCSVAFVDAGESAAVGWVGEGRVTLRLNGEPHEPNWVIVRDEDGREARAASLPSDAAIHFGLEFWPLAEDGSEAPVAIEADWHAGGLEPVADAGASGPVSLAEPQAPAEPAAAGTPLAYETIPSMNPADDGTGAALPLQQPGLAPSPHDHTAAGMDAFSSGAPGAEDATEAAQADPAEDPEARHPERVGVDLRSREVHPVARWLGKLFDLVRKPRPVAGEMSGEPPVSTYDTLLSDSVPPTALEQASGEPTLQTSLELPSVPLPPDFDSTPDAVPGFAIEDLLPPEAAPSHGTPEAGEGIPPVELTPITPEPIAAPPPRPVGRIVIRHVEPLVSAPAVEPRTHVDLVRQMGEVDAATLPTLRVPELPNASVAPLRIEREPEGADSTFAMPRLPSLGPPPAAAPLERLPIAPEERAAPAAPAPAPPTVPRIEPTGPPVLRVTPEPRSGPPIITVRGGPTTGKTPPMLRVTPSELLASPIIPTAPVAPIVLGPARMTPPPLPTPAPAAMPSAEIAPASPESDESPSAADAAGTTAGTAVETAGVAAPAEEGAEAALPRAPRRRWPPPELEAPQKSGLPRKAWIWVGAIAAVFAAGWLLGIVTNPSGRGDSGPLAKLMRAVGLAAPHYMISVDSSPNGAWIAVDGKDVARRTPSDIEVPPGRHKLTISLPDLGGVDVDVSGERGEHLSVSPDLDGSLEVLSSDAAVPISVSLDGRPIGFAPVRLETVVPGLHELQFSGPGMPAWAQTVEVGVRRTAQVVAHPMSAPANGIVQVQATLNDQQGATPLSGAQVYVDGQLRGITPTTIELPRGPHSLRLVWHGETAPVQVIDLPGGNQRFATFNFGLDTPSPLVTLLGAVHPATAEEQVVVSASLSGLQPSDVRESWLHVSTPEGLWRRYPMTPMSPSQGSVLASVFPSGAFDSHGTARWYVSASTLQGDEYFSEMQVATVGAAAPPRGRRGAGFTPKP